MIASRDSASAVDGGLARHIPVLGGRITGFLDVHDGGVYIDATFGAGGYTRKILSTADCRVIAIDRDPVALAQGAELVEAATGRLVLSEDRFSDLAAVAASHGHAAVDGIVFDLGVSSMQIDDGARGFSFRHDGPLDMRMGERGPSAADVVAQASERDLSFIIATLGEEHQARAIARAIVRARATEPIRTTRALATLVERIVRTKPGAIHPATRTFQGLRIFVNQELQELVGALAAAEKVLRPGGRLVVVAFHSLEDRIVKTFLTDRGRHAGTSRHQPEAEAPALTFRILTGRPVTPDEEEIAGNPRARSAKLRAAERTTASARDGTVRDMLPNLPSLAEVMSGEAPLIRFLNICVIAVLVCAAAYVYKIKFELTRQAERLAKLRLEIRREHDAIATLRAEWSRLDNPSRIQELANRHLALKPIDARQFDRLNGLPERPPDLVPPDAADPIGVLLDQIDVPDLPTASTRAAKGKR